MEEEIIKMLRELLRGHEGEMYATDYYLAVMGQDENLYLVFGDMRNKDEEELNQIFVQFLDELIRKEKAKLN